MMLGMDVQLPLASANGGTPPREEPVSTSLLTRQLPDQSQRTKGKLGQRKRGRGAAGQHEEIPLSASQAVHVRLVKVDAKRDGFTEERASTTVTLSKFGRAPQLQLSEDRLSVTGSKGFRTVRATHGAYQGGSWYCEVTIKHLGATGHVRLGWCTNRAELQAPVGFDAHGFCYRDIDGSKVTEGLREPYGEGYKEGDVVGLFIHMPDGGRHFEALDRTVGRYKGTLYLVHETTTEPQALLGSLVAFTVNGKYQGIAYRNVREGTYYPAASIYTMPSQTEGAIVTFKFGPDFKYPPPTVEGCPPAQPCSLLSSLTQASLGQVETTAVSASLGQVETTAVSASLGQVETTAVSASLGQVETTAVSASLGQVETTAVSASLGQVETTAVSASLGQAETTAVSAAPVQIETTAVSAASLGQVETTAVSAASLGQVETTAVSASLGQVETTAVSAALGQVETTAVSAAPGQVETTAVSGAPVQVQVETTAVSRAIDPPVQSSDETQILASEARSTAMDMA